MSPTWFIKPHGYPHFSSRTCPGKDLAMWTVGPTLVSFVARVNANTTLVCFWRCCEQSELQAVHDKSDQSDQCCVSWQDAVVEAEEGGSSWTNAQAMMLVPSAAALVVAVVLLATVAPPSARPKLSARAPVLVCWPRCRANRLSLSTVTRAPAPPVTL